MKINANTHTRAHTPTHTHTHTPTHARTHTDTYWHIIIMTTVFSITSDVRTNSIV